MVLGIAKRGLGLLGKTGNIRSKGKIIGSRIAKPYSPQAMGTPRPPMKKSDFRLKNQLKKIQKMPDKKFKYNNPETTKARTRHGFVYDKPKSAPVKGSIGKKKYKQDWTIGHRAHQRMGLIKD